MTGEAPVLDLDLHDADLVADPFPHYERIRAAGRCVYNGRAEVWMVTGYDDAVAIFRDTRCFSSRVLADDTFGPWYDGAPTMLGSDPPEHTRLRGAVRSAFTARALARWGTVVARSTTELLDSGVDDVITDLAYPLTALVTARVLGVPGHDTDRFIRWTHDMATGSVANALGDISTYRCAVDAGRELADYVRGLVARRSSSQDDLIGVLLRAEQDGRVSRPEVVATCVLLLLAATETTAKLIGNAVVLLAEHPDQRHRLLDDPALLPSAVEEVLRFSGPAQFDPRLVTDTCTVGGVRLAEADVVWVLTAAAGRDPHRFAEPGRFDIGRTPNPHLAFGYGPHRCVGATLARLEARVVLAALLRTVPDYTIEHADYGRGFFVRGPVSLRVRASGQAHPGLAGL